MTGNVEALRPPAAKVSEEMKIAATVFSLQNIREIALGKSSTQRLFLFPSIPVYVGALTFYFVAAHQSSNPFIHSMTSYTLALIVFGLGMLMYSNARLRQQYIEAVKKGRVAEKESGSTIDSYALLDDSTSHFARYGYFYVYLMLSIPPIAIMLLTMFKR